MSINIHAYNFNKKMMAYIKFVIISLSISFIVTSVIYVINTYWYQESKKNRVQVLSNQLFTDIKDSNVLDISEFVAMTKYILEKSNEKVVLSVSQQKSKKMVKISNKQMDEYPHSHYFHDKKSTVINIENKIYNLEYHMKKRLGNHVLYDLLPAISFSFFADKEKLEKYNLHQKSYVFYSFFLAIYIGMILSSLIYKRMKNNIEHQEKELNELIKNHDEQQRLQYAENDEYKKQYEVEKYKNMNIEKIENITGTEHKYQLVKSIESAQNNLYILSGWISISVLNAHIMELLEKALARGVNIFIGFGYGSSSGNCNRLDTLEPQYRKALDELSRLKNKHNFDSDKGNLSIGYFPNHQKILLKDNDYIICGSNNWLSNWQFNNAEKSFKIYSKPIIQTEQNRIRSLIEKNNITDCV